MTLSIGLALGLGARTYFGVTVNGVRAVVVGDSRQDNGISPQAGSGTNRTTGVPASMSVQSMVDALLQELDYPVEVVGQWTLGGSKSSQMVHDHALAVQAARNPDVVFLLGPTNDVIDYTGSGGLGPIPTGDPNLDPAFLPRVGDREPVGNGVGQQGTTFGNLDKALRFWNDGVANGLGRSVPVVLWEIATGNASRKPRNRTVYEWILAQKAAGRYPNLITSPSAYTCMLTDPAQIDGPVENEVIRSDLKGDGTQGADSEDNFLHPTHAEARHIGRAMATDPEILAAFAGRSSLLTLPTGSNDASFINSNPAIAVGDGSGTLGYAGSNTPNPTGTVAQSWSLGHNVSTGTIAVAASFDSGDQVVTVSRTGGSLPSTARTVQLRGAAVNITPVAGDVYVLDAEFEAPARDPLDLFGVDTGIFVFESGLVDDRGQSIASATYGAMINRAPNPFAPDGGTYRIHGVPLEITPAIVASATGTIPLEPRFTISFSDAMDTATNGDLVVKLKSAGIRKLTGYSHVSPPAVPATGATCSVAPSITGNFFVGSTVTLNNGTFSAGSVTARRLLRNGVVVASNVGTYTFTEADEGAYFIFEVVNTNSGATTTAQSAITGPITVMPEELADLVGALDGVQNNAIGDFRNATSVGNNYSSPDISGNNNNFVQTAASTRHPGIDPTLGGIFDGSNDCAGYTWQTAAPTTVSAIMHLRKTPASIGAKSLLSDGTTGTTNRAGLYSSGDATALTGTWTVDGVSVTTRAALYTALDDGLDHTVMVTGLNVSAWPAIFVSKPNTAHQGSIRKAVIIDEATTGLATARALAVTYVEAA